MPKKTKPAPEMVLVPKAALVWFMREARKEVSECYIPTLCDRCKKRKSCADAVHHAMLAHERVKKGEKR